MLDQKTLEKVLSEKKEIKLTQKQKEENIIEWTTFYRQNIDIAIEDFLEIPVHEFQKNIFTTIQDNDISTLVCSRGSSKSFCTAIVATTMALLYSNCNILVTSLTLSQSNLVIKSKIDKELSNEKSGLSPVLRQLRKDGYMTFHKDTNTGGEIVEFGNGSKIFACALGESMRGHRAQIVILDEAAICSRGLYLAIAEPTLTQRIFGGRPSDYVEEPKQILLSSAKSRTNWLYKQLVRCVNGYFKNSRIKYGFVCVDVLSAVASGIQTPNQYRQRKQNTDDLTFQQEYLNIFLSSSETSLFKLEDFENNQILDKPFYPRNIYEIMDKKENPYKFSDDWVRIVVCDIALSGANDDDNSVYGFLRVNKQTGRRQLESIYITHGLNTVKQAALMKRFFYEYKATYFMHDSKGLGQGIYDVLTTETYDEELGTYYPAWTVCADKDLQIISDSVMTDKVQRTISQDALQVIVPYVGTAELNSQMHLSLRKALKDKHIDILKDEYEMKEIIQDKDPNFILKSPEEKAEILNPYLQTRLMVNEAISLEMKMLEGGNIKLTEASRLDVKDRYITVAMGNLLADKIEAKYKKDSEETEFDINDFSEIYNY